MSNAPNGAALKLVSAALDLSTLSDLAGILKSVAEAVGADGCVLWEAAPEPASRGQSPRQQVTLLAQWFSGGRHYDVPGFPPGQSPVGVALTSQRSVSIPDIARDEQVAGGRELLRRLGIRSLHAVPLSFPDGTAAALTLYWATPSVLDDTNARLADELAPLVPCLYQALRDRIGLRLIRRVAEILNLAERDAAGAPLPMSRMKQVVQEICQQITDTFQCLETSVFLEDPLRSPGKYQLTATTWPWRDEFKKRIYTKQDRGLTGWVLKHAGTVKLFDLSRFDRGKEITNREYPGLVWNDSLRIEEAVRRYRELGSDAPLPPLSFMAAPVLAGEHVRGVVRCAVPLEVPYYFGKRDLDLLTLVANQFGQLWSNWVSRREAEEENRSWRMLYDSVSQLNEFVRGELTKDTPSERAILERALDVTSKVFPGAAILSIRWLDEARRELRFEVTLGEAWSKGSPEDIRARLEHCFPIDGNPAGSAGAHVCQTGQVYVDSDVRTGRYYDQLFPEVRREWVSPITVEGRVIGVLDVCVTTDDDFPRETARIGELMGQQLGLYHYLATALAKLRSAEADLRRHVDAQTQAYEDLAHQLNSPLFHARARVEIALKDTPDDRRLRVIRGLLGKAGRVARGTRLFAALSQGNPILVRGDPLRYEPLIKMLSEAAEDYQFMVDRERNVRFKVLRHTFEPLNSVIVPVDSILLGQAVHTLLDNAAKYCYRDTEVRIYGGLMGSDRFHVSVMNKGLRMSKDDAEQCKTREWRGDLARLTVGEGTGIGLWIVDNIMRAHCGDLVVVPTNVEGWNDIKLVFLRGDGRR